MTIEIRTFLEESKYIETIARAFGWKEVKRIISKSSLTLGGVTVPKYLITYECESNNEYLSTIYLDLLKVEMLMERPEHEHLEYLKKKN
jgi:hypothetical protein